MCDDDQRRWRATGLVACPNLDSLLYVGPEFQGHGSVLGSEQMTPSLNEEVIGEVVRLVPRDGDGPISMIFVKIRRMTARGGNDLKHANARSHAPSRHALGRGYQTYGSGLGETPATGWPNSARVDDCSMSFRVPNAKS